MSDTMRILRVEADVVDAEGGGDGAYDLLGDWEVPAFLEKLKECLEDEGPWLSNAKGQITLRLEIMPIDLPIDEVLDMETPEERASQKKANDDQAFCVPE